MFEPYLKYLGYDLLSKFTKLLFNTSKLTTSAPKMVRKFLNIFDLPEKTLDMLLSRLALKAPAEQKRFVEFVFLIHKIAIVLALVTLYLMST